MFSLRYYEMKELNAYWVCSSVRIAMGWGLDGRGSIPDRGKKFFATPQRPDRLWGLFFPIQCVPGVKRQGREADHSPPPKAEIKNGDTFTPPYVPMAWCLIN
jgi:hypothetical protein